MGIHPTRVGRRLLETTWWSMYEGLFCDLSLDPAHVIVQPGDELVFCAFPGAGTSPTPKRELHAEVLQRLVNRDVSGAGDALIQLLSPLPFIDVNGFRKRVEVRLSNHLLAMEDKEAPPLERTSIGVWRALLDVARAEGVPVHMDALRLIIATSTVEAMVATLRPQVNVLREFERYAREADLRRARAFVRNLSRNFDRDPQAMFVARVAEGSETLNRLWFWLQSNSRTLPVDYVSLSSKGAYALSIILRVTIVVGLVALVVAGAGLAGTQGLPAALGHPVTVAVGVVLGLLALRRILFRLNDLEEEV
jgi:predicted unusual protein kinase regulating ubiquinone biosynthesis (AarF/ABC1/UbiB family)